MIKELWPGVSLEKFNEWYPLTGEIKETPEQYIATWPDKDKWFKTFALRAQNDINAYLNDILRRFDFTSFKDERIQETLIDMVFVVIEHWVYNRTPIEFNSDASLTFNNGQTQINAFATPTINIWDLHPSRMKIWANFTQLKYIFDTSEDGLADANLIDLDQFYTKTQTDEKFETKEDHKKDINNLQTEIDTKANKNDIPDITNLETKEDHKKDIDNLQDQVDGKQYELFEKTGDNHKFLGKGFLNMSDKQIAVLGDPTNDKDAINKQYLEKQLAKKQAILTVIELMKFFETDEFYVTEGGTKIGNGPWGPSTTLNKTITKDSQYSDLTTEVKTLIGAINEINSKSPEGGWIIGEYKWMPIGSKMPNGWVKVEIKDGYTLINGTTAGESVGSVQNHTHDFLVKSDIIAPRPQYVIDQVTKSITNWNWTGNLVDESDITHVDNLAAGKYAELWQYDPNNKYSPSADEPVKANSISTQPLKEEK